MNITIRPLEPADWETLQSLNAMLFESDAAHDDDLDTSWPFSENAIAYYKRICENQQKHGLLAELDGGPIGYVAFSEKDFGYRKGAYVEIENIAVMPEYRSHGVGKQLMSLVEDWANEKKADRLYVEAFAKNKGARSFYVDFGFSEIGIQLQKDI